MGVDARLARGAGARLQALPNEREHGALALGRKAEPRQRAGHDFRRGGLEVEQEAERVRQIEVGEVLQDLAFYPPVEQARQDRPAQEHLPAFWIQLQHRGREAREHHAGDAGIEGAEQRRHVTELLRERLCRRLRVGLVVGQA